MHYFYFNGGSKTFDNGLAKFLLFFINQGREISFYEAAKLKLVEQIDPYSLPGNSPILDLQSGYSYNIFATEFSVAKLFVFYSFPDMQKLSLSFFIRLQELRKAPLINIKLPPLPDVRAADKVKAGFYNGDFRTAGRFLTAKEVASVLPDESLSRKLYMRQSLPPVAFLKKWISVTKYEAPILPEEVSRHRRKIVRRR